MRDKGQTPPPAKTNAWGHSARPACCSFPLHQNRVGARRFVGVEAWRTNERTPRRAYSRPSPLRMSFSMLSGLCGGSKRLVGTPSTHRNLPGYLGGLVGRIRFGCCWGGEGVMFVFPFFGGGGVWKQRTSNHDADVPKFHGISYPLSPSPFGAVAFRKT